MCLINREAIIENGEAELGFRPAQFPILCHKEEGDCVRSNMASCAVIIGSVDEIAHVHPLLDLIHHVERVLVGVGVRNADDLLLRLHNVVADKRNQRIERGLASAAFLVLYDIAVLVASKDRLDVQNIADKSGRAAEPSGVGEILQIAYGKDAVHAGRVRLKCIGNGVHLHALFAHFAGVDRKDPLREGSVQGIEQTDLAVFGRILHQLFRGDTGGVEGAADTAAQRDIENIFPLFHDLPKIIFKIAAADQAGFYLGAGADRVIIFFPFAPFFFQREIRVETGHAVPIHEIDKRNHVDVVLFYKLCRNVGGRVYNDLKHGFFLIFSRITAQEDFIRKIICCKEILSVIFCIVIETLLYIVLNTMSNSI